PGPAFPNRGRRARRAPVPRGLAHLGPQLRPRSSPEEPRPARSGLARLWLPPRAPGRRGPHRRAPGRRDLAALEWPRPMLARGIRSYHRPTRIEDALALATQGVVPMAGGTRLLASDVEVPNVLDLSALGLNGIQVEDSDLVLGSMVALQDVIDSP